MASLSREAIMMENKQPCAQDDMGPINSSTVYAQYSKKKNRMGIQYGSMVGLIYLH